MSEVAAEFLKALPGMVGSAISSLRYRSTSWLQVWTAFFGGTALAYWGSEHLATWMHTPVNLTRLLLGIFGMAITIKVFETIEALDVKALSERIFKRIGL